MPKKIASIEFEGKSYIIGYDTGTGKWYRISSVPIELQTLPEAVICRAVKALVPDGRDESVKEILMAEEVRYA